MHDWSSHLLKISKLAFKPGFARYDLHFIRNAEKIMGYPSDSFESIHVAGTNGKGSFWFKTAKALELSGAKVGLFTSPHITTIRERITVNSELISKDFWIDFLNRTEKMDLKIGENITFFDYQVLLAFWYFKEQKIDVAVIEAGLGGIWDSTNIVRNPLLSVITGIGLDHTEILGNTKEEILCNINHNI